jgi:hypothetical protein
LALDDYVALAVSAIDRAQIQELGTSLTEARTSEAAAKSELSKAEQAEKDTEKDLANGEPAVDTSALQDAIDHARSEGDADSRLANLKTTIARRRDAISKDLLRAGRWAGGAGRLRRARRTPTHCYAARRSPLRGKSGEPVSASTGPDRTAALIHSAIGDFAPTLRVGPHHICYDGPKGPIVSLTRWAELWRSDISEQDVLTSA